LPELERILATFFRPYPLGLGFWGEIGFVISNPILANRSWGRFEDLWRMFNADADQYHGATAWGWPFAGLAGGLHRTVMKAIDEDGVLDREFTLQDILRLKPYLERCRDAAERLGGLINSELWGYRPSPDGKTAVALPLWKSTKPQLWSVSPLSLLIADALARRLAAIAPLPPDHPDASLAAFTVPGAGEAIDKAIDADLQAPGVTDVTAAYRDSPRLIKQERADYLLPTVVHCTSPDAAIAGKEYMFPFVTVVECPEARMLDAIGPTLVCSAITCNPAFRRRLLDAVHIDRLNLGPVPTTQLNWLQPHEGNLIEFLFRERAFQTADL